MHGSLLRVIGMEVKLHSHSKIMALAFKATSGHGMISRE